MADPRFSPDHLYAAAVLYYVEHRTQVEVAARIGVSRPTVSRLLAEARRVGIVTIEVVPPRDLGGAQARRIAAALGLVEVRLVPPSSPGEAAEACVVPAVASMLAAAGLGPGAVLVVTSGRTVWHVAQGTLPNLPGVVVVPAIGGMDEYEPWFQTNEITRLVATRIAGVPRFLYAPALPGPDEVAALRKAQNLRSIAALWRVADAAVLGIGGPPSSRADLPTFMADSPGVLNRAAGDVTSRFFDALGAAVRFPGEARLVATTGAQLRRIPLGIGAAVGQAKVGSILGAARAGFINRLVTDLPTGHAVLAALQHGR